MSPSDSAGLFAQTMDLRKGSHELQEEHLPVMRQEIQLSAKALLEDVHGVFTELADQHKLQYSGKHDFACTHLACSSFSMPHMSDI